MKPRAELTAGAIMSSPLVTLDRGTPLAEAARDLNEYGISGAVVTGNGERPVGVVSMFDIVAYLAGLDRPAEAADDVSRQTPVNEIMTSGIVGVPVDATVMEVARTMWKRHIHRVIVMRGREAVGIISTMDVLRALTGGPRRVRARAAKV